MQLNEGDGAFYGPKIDITVFDALRRKFQCATIQLDFQLPNRFDLKYADSEGGYQRPVIVHRAILGSVERMFAILTEHYAGKWPLWLSPRQVSIPVPLELRRRLWPRAEQGLFAPGLLPEVGLRHGGTPMRIAAGTWPLT